MPQAAPEDVWAFDPEWRGDPQSGLETDLLPAREDGDFGPDGGPPAEAEARYLPEKAGFAARLRFAAEERWLDFRDGAAADFARENDAGSLFNFVPVAIGLGIAAYFVSPSEPSILALVATMLVAAAVAARMRSRGALFTAMAALALFLTGMSAAKLQAMRSTMPVPVSGFTATISGVILETDHNKRGAPRYLIRPVAIEGLSQDKLPKRARLSASSRHVAMLPGDAITGLARMQPVNGPAYPGGYDFALFAWFEGLGLSGFFMGAPAPAKIPPVLTLGESIAVLLADWRAGVTARIRAGLPGEAGDIAAALVTGDRTGLSEKTQESLRRSGLAHILAISGLHMALVTLTVIWLVRLWLNLVPGLADRHPIKKWAMFAGFMAATVYLFLAGAGIATQRAWIMISVMLAAGLMDRMAITMRSVAIAAVLILLIQPISLFHPGFQMSFAAVAALVAVFREWSTRRRVGDTTFKRSQAPPARLLRYFGGLAATSLIAGAATALFGAWHFHRVALLGVFANLAAMPVVSAAVMPLALFSMILMPYGFETLALAPLGYAINCVVWISDRINETGSAVETGIRPAGMLAWSALMLVLATGLRSRLRLLALIPAFFLVYGLWAAPPNDIPDILISQDGRAIAVAGDALEGGRTGRLTLAYPSRNRFVTDIWRRGYTPGVETVKLPEGGECGRDSCRFKARGRRVAVIYDPDLLAEACRIADILIAPRLWWVNCRDRQPDLVLRRGDFEYAGCHMIRLPETGEKPVVETAWPRVFLDREGLPLATDPSGNPVRARRPWLERFDPGLRFGIKQAKPTGTGAGKSE